MRVSSLIKSVIRTPNHLFKKVMNPVNKWVHSSFGQAKPSPKSKLNGLENRAQKLSSKDQPKLHPELEKIFGEELQLSASKKADPAESKNEVYAKFAEDFASKAKNSEQFHDLMQRVYGESYDKSEAETFRQKALKGDFEWLPPIKFLGENELGQANGAYNKEEGVVYLNEKLLDDPKKAVATYTEEVGHHLDTKLKTQDTAGDEGEMFRRLMANEKLSQADIQAIRSENDKGTIQVDGKQVEVEFWKLGDGLKKAWKGVKSAFGKVKKGVEKVLNKGKEAVQKTVAKVASGVKKAFGKIASGAKKVLNFGKKVFGGAVNGVKTLANGLIDAGKKTFQGLGEGLKGFGQHLAKGKFTKALKSLGQGIDKGILQLPGRLGSTVLNSAKTATDGVLNALGKFGKPLKSVSDKLYNVANTALQTGTGIIRDFIRIVPEVAVNAADDLWASAKEIFKGNFKDGIKKLAMTPVKAIGNTVGGVLGAIGGRLTFGVGSAISNVIGLEKNVTSKALDGQMKSDLEAFYGDSLDLSTVQVKQGGFGPVGAPRTVGNTIYIPKSWNDDQLIDDNGQLTDIGRKLIMHEMAHVWQNQNGGGDYMHKSIWNQINAAIKGGSRNGAYDWATPVAEGKSFDQLNPEQQAHAIEVANWLQSQGIALSSTSDISYVDPDTGDTEILTVAQQNFLRDVMNQVANGEGAP